MSRATSSLANNNQVRLYQNIILSLFCCFSIACQQHNVAVLEADLPIHDSVYLDVVDYINGHVILKDTIVGEHVDKVLGHIPTGIYQVFFSWKRHLLTHREMQAIARGSSPELPRYVLTNTCWINAKEASTYRTQLSKQLTQDEIEEALTKGSPDVYLTLESSDNNTRLYNEYLAIVRRFKQENEQQKKNIRQLFYAHNKQGNWGDSKKMYDQLRLSWIPEVHDALVQDEIEFMLRNHEEPVISHIFFAQTHTLKDVERYKAVFEKFSPEVQAIINKKIVKLQAKENRL